MPRTRSSVESFGSGALGGLDGRMQKNTKTPATSPRQSATSNRRRVPRCTEPSSVSFRESTADKPQENICSCSTSVTDSKYLTFGGCKVVLQTPKNRQRFYPKELTFVFASIPYSDTVQTRVFCCRKGHVGTVRCSMVGANYGFHFGTEIVPRTCQTKTRIVGIFRPQNKKPGPGTHYGCPIRGLKNETQKWT